MKKNILFIFITILALSAFSKIAFAITPTPTGSFNQEQINALTNKIASKVAQLNLVEKRGVIGKVTDVSSTQITLNDTSGSTRFVDVDEFTKFNSDSQSFGISDIEKGQKIGVLGLYNKESRRILARLVEVLQIPDFIHGSVSKIDEDNFSLEVSTEKDKQIKIEVENTTKTLSFDNEKSELIKSGFSKIKTGDSIIITGFPSKTESGTVNALRIILLPGVSKNPKIKIQSKPSLTETPTSSPTPTILPKKDTSN